MKIITIYTPQSEDDSKFWVKFVDRMVFSLAEEGKSWSILYTP